VIGQNIFSAYHIRLCRSFLCDGKLKAVACFYPQTNTTDLCCQIETFLITGRLYTSGLQFYLFRFLYNPNIFWQTFKKQSGAPRGCFSWYMQSWH